MKETVLDVLMFLFEHVVANGQELRADDQKVISHLELAGFEEPEIQKAFVWLDDLLEMEAEIGDFKPVNSRAIRMYTSEEQERLDTECRGLLMFLEQVGVIDSSNRELIIDRLMALQEDEITVEEVKWVTLFVLFSRQGFEAEFAWMEDFIYEGMHHVLH